MSTRGCREPIFTSVKRKNGSQRHSKERQRNCLIWKVRVTLGEGRCRVNRPHWEAGLAGQREFSGRPSHTRSVTVKHNLKNQCSRTLIQGTSKSGPERQKQRGKTSRPKCFHRNSQLRPSPPSMRQYCSQTTTPGVRPTALTSTVESSIYKDNAHT